MSTTSREGSLEAPTRHPLGQNDPGFYDESALMDELERVYDICHGCRRCVSLCNAFPTLFDLVDESETMEVDGVDKQDFWKVVDHCYLCDLCYLTKCPYVPPHEWNVDFPHLMLRAKAIGYKKGRAKFRDKLVSSTDTVGSFASIPIVANVVNAANRNEHTRALLESALGVHADARLPEYHSKTLSKRSRDHKPGEFEVVNTDKTTGKVAIFATCYGEYNEPQVATAGRQGSAGGLRTHPDSDHARQGHGLLRHAETRARRPRCGGKTQGSQYPAAGQAGRRGLGYHLARALLYPSVQTGIATDVSRGRRR
jgi:ferredoxin